MYKINRLSSNIPSSRRNITITPSAKRNLFSKTGLVRDLRDYHSLLNKHSLDRLNSMKRLTKENISTFDFQRLKNKKQTNSTLQAKDNTEERQIYRNSILPKIPDYKPIHTQNNDNIEKSNQNNTPKTFEEAQNMLKTRKIQSQEDMAKVFNAIMNGDAIQPKTDVEMTTLNNQKNEVNQQNKQNIEISDQQKANIKLEVLKQLKQKIINDDHIDYNQIYDICNNLYSQFPKNSMIKSILMRAIDRFNRSQFYKIPDDRIKQLVQIVIINLKKIYK